MTPDTALVDLDAEETTPALAQFLRGRAEESLGAGVSTSRAAVLTGEWLCSEVGHSKLTD